jgi:hypothetical protein
MQMRIRYDFDGPIGVSRNTYGTANGNVRVVVDKDNFKFEIVDHDGKAVVTGGNTKNYIVLLRQAKKALIALGYGFNKEDRNRDYGLVRKKIRRASRLIKNLELELYLVKRFSKLMKLK